MHEVLVNGLGGLSLPTKSVVRLTDRPDMTLDVYRGRKTTMQQMYCFHGCFPVSCFNYLYEKEHGGSSEVQADLRNTQQLCLSVVTFCRWSSYLMLLMLTCNSGIIDYSSLMFVF